MGYHKKIFLFFCTIFIFQFSFAQEPDETLRTAWFTQNGTARNIAVGGALASLGGDITAAHVNPAGIGLYKTREFVFTPSFNFNNNKINFRGTDSSSKKFGYMGGTAGFVFGGTPRYSNSRWSGYAFAITYNQLANFNNHISYSGLNNYSSFSEKYLEELANDGADTTAALYNYPYGSSLAFWTYLVDTTTVNGQFGYKSLVPVSTGVYQYYDAVTTGGYNEIALSIAGNKSDNLYLGASLTIPFVNYNRNFTYSEKDATSNPNNNFSSFTYNETLKSSGIGVGLKLGAIAKLGDYFRVGAAFHTPQIISFEDEIRSSIIANTEQYAGTRTQTSDALTDNTPGKREYNLVTPWRAIVSGSYIFATDIGDTKQQKGFISADIEYVNYKASRYSAVDKSNSALVDYYSAVNDATKNYFKGNVNIKVGGELKFDPLMVRAGFAYYGSPYADKSLHANKTIVSGGIGYRKFGIFVDLTYAYDISKDVNFPYRLNDVANTYANVKNNVGNLTLTFGVKF